MKEFSPNYFFNLSQFQHAALFYDCNYVWEALSCLGNYLKKCELGKISIKIPAGVHLVNPELITIEEGSTVEPGAYIKGPCIIGKDSTIRHGAYIRGNVITGDRCVIGHDTEVKNSIFLNDANAAHFAYVGDSILGNKVNLGAGTVCANLKLKRDTVFVTFEEKKIDTGLKKFGAILGDGCQTGCNSVTNPGTLMGKNSFCYPCMNFGGFIPANHTVKSQNKAKIIPQ